MNTYAYRKKSTGEYPRFQGDVRLEHPEIGDVFICPDTYEPVYEGIIPELPQDTVLVELPPTKVGGVWVQQLTTTPVLLTLPKQLDLITKSASQRETKIFATATTGRIPVHIID